jgi:4-amino-4-deoxy-L-arabinose transferase-like glycosyltransferase
VVLPFTALALAGTYWLGAVTFGRGAGAAAALLLGATPMTLSIGNMVLPEMPLTALSVLALLAFARGRLVVAAALGCALVLIKETGVFTPLAIAGALVLEGLRARSLRAPATLARLALSLSPVAVLGAFFVWQRLSPAGYFVFPHHQHLLFDRPFGLSDLATALPSLLLWHGRSVLLLGALLWLGAEALPKRRGRGASEAKSEVAPDRAGAAPPRRAVVAAMLLLAAANAIFFAKMFWLPRYALPAHPGLLILLCGVLLGGGMATVGVRTRRTLLAARLSVLAVAFALGLRGLHAPTRPNEAELTFAYAAVIETHRAAYRQLLEASEGDPTVLTSWPMTVELRHPYVGYLDRPVRAIHVDGLTEEAAREPGFVIVPRWSRHAAPLREHARRLGLRRIGVHRRGGSPQTLELYGP